MRIIRTTILLGLGVLLLPADAAQQARVYDGAKATLGWTMTFCDRNAATCVQGREAWAVFAKKAEFAGKLALDLINERSQQVAGAARQGPKGAELRPATPDPVSVLRRGTLKPADLEPGWRGKLATIGG